MKVQRFLSIFVILCMLLSSTPTAVFAEEGNEQTLMIEDSMAEEAGETNPEESEEQQEAEQEEQQQEEQQEEAAEESEINFVLLEKSPEELTLDEQAKYFMLKAAFYAVSSSIALFADENAVDTKPVFKISSADQLVDLAEKVEKGENYWGGKWADASYEQISNINLSGIAWKGIGTTSVATFKGRYNGKGYSITNLNAEKGVFGYVTNGTIKNLAVKDCTIKGSSDVGAVVGTAVNTTIKNCWTSGSVTTNGSNGGGIVSRGSDGTIENCYSLCSVSAASTAGGIAGDLSGTKIKNCAFLGENVTATTAAYRIAKGGIPSDNYAWKETTINGSTVSDGTANNANGADITFGTGGFSKSFAEIFNNDTTWNYSKDLPVLANDIPGSNFPEYLYTNAVMGEFKGKGTEEDPYLIESKTDLINFRNKVNGGSTVDDKTGGNNYSGKYFKQTANIDLSGEEWIPIANSKGYSVPNNSFQGIYDGGGYIIKNLTVKNDNVRFAGLFGYLKGNSVIKNLGVEDCNIQTKNEFGYAGAIVGATNKGQGTVQNCYSTGTVYGEWCVGGIIGSGGKKVTNCFSLCDVSLKERIAGGIVGGADGGWASIENCIFLGRSVSGKDELTSDNGPYTSRIACNTKSKHTNNYAWNRTKVNEEEISENNAEYGADKSHGANLTYDSVNKLSKQFSAIFGTIDGESASSVWNFEDNMLPTLKNENVTRATSLPSWMTSGSTTASADFAGKGTAADPYLIQSKDDLIKFRKKVIKDNESYAGKYFKQTANIDLSGEEWIPIGTNNDTTKFSGTYDGGGHEITNLKNDKRYEGGLFGYLSGTVKNLAVINCNVSYNNGYSGAVVASGGTVTNCYSTGKVSGKQCGGISGNGSTITNCYSTAKVTGTDSSYGIGANPSKIDKCVALNNEISGTEAGRVGSKQTLTNNYALKEMKVNNAAVTTGNTANGVNGADLTVGNGKLYKADGTEFNWSGYDTKVWMISSESGVLPYLTHSSKVALNMGEQNIANITLDTSVQTYTYDKTARAFELKNVNPKSVTVNVAYRKNGTDDSFSTTAPTNAGSYDVRLTSNGGTDISPYENVISGGLVIEKAERNFKITSPQNNQTYSYSGKALSEYFSHAVTYDKDDSENIENSIENKIYKVDASSTEQLVESDFTAVLGVGEYRLVSSVLEIGNYKADSASITFKITKANNQITSFTFPNSWAYGETAKTPTATAAFGTVNFKYSADGNTWVDAQPTEAGAYKIKAYVEGTSNYAGAEQVKDFTITQATPTVAEVPTASRVRVGRMLSDSILSGGKALDLNQEVLSGAWAWKDGTEVMNQRGDMIRTVVFIPENPNYCAVEKDISVAVYKKHSSNSDEQNIYTVTFNTGDKKDAITKQIKQNETVAKPKNPEKEGYAFGGWYTDKALTKKYDFDSKVTKNFTLYAKWVKDETADEKMQIILIVGEKDATVFGEKVTNDVAPVIVNSRTMLPARFVAEALGASVYWNGETRRVTIISRNDEQKDIAILIDIDSDIAYVNGERIHLDSPAFIENGRTYLPIRFICETLGTSVDWIQDELKIIITKK